VTTIFDKIYAAIDFWTETHGTEPNAILIGNKERKALLEEAHKCQMMPSTYMNTISGCRVYAMHTDKPYLMACRMQVAWPSNEEKLAEALGPVIRQLKEM
jgi:hypothetical protein